MANERAGFWAHVQETLKSTGIDIELPDLSHLDPANCKMICMPIGLGESLREMGREPRDHVVMVRVDEDSKRRLDSWVETGAVKSRSEAAALFIREGLKVRAHELRELEDALRDVESAKDRLREKARRVLREDEVAKDADGEG